MITARENCFIIVLVLVACVAGRGEAQTVFPGNTWEVATPESQGVDPARLQEAIDYMDANFDPDGAKELVVVRNGRLIWEGPAADAYHPVFSCTKTFTSTALGLLVDDGKCALDDLALRFEPKLANDHPLYAKIKLRHLAAMCGGYRGEVKDVREEDQPWGDVMAYLNPREPDFEAGTTVRYNDHDVFLLGKILTLLVRQPLQEVFQQRIAGPIGMTKWEWGVSGTVDGIPLNNPPGNPGGLGAGGIKTTPREMARFGLLMLNRGNWNGKQLISASFVDEATSNQVPVSWGFRNRDFRGRYGYYWWVNGVMADGKRPWPNAPPRTYMSHGKGGNFCCVVPEWNLVLVRMGEPSVRDQHWDEFFRRLAAAIDIEPAHGPDKHEAANQPLHRTVDLNLGESQSLEMSDGTPVTVRLIELQESRDEMPCSAVREAKVTVEVNGQAVVLTSATYHLPVTVAGAQIDCPVTKGYIQNARTNRWGLDKDARVRLWPAGAPWIAPGTFVYPAVQRWFASDTQMANEPVFVNGGEKPENRNIYYHWGLDIGGCEGKVDVVSATEGLVVSDGKRVLPGHENIPGVSPTYDEVNILDARGWYYCYCHLQSIDPGLRLGERVKMGQKIGVLGKEGGSGGWSHLHFHITARQPSGKWGVEEGYAFLWQAYLHRHAPELIAVARPHHFASVGQKVTLDGARSWSAAGSVASHEWTFFDGQTATGSKVERTYNRPGTYSEVLKVADAQGNVDYDFAVVQVVDRASPERLTPTIHAAYAPTFGIRPGDEVTFKVRTFRTTEGEETWDFGDGSPAVIVKSDGNVVPRAADGYAETVHRYAKPGHYLVRVERRAKDGSKAIGCLHVRVVASAADAPSE